MPLPVQRKPIDKVVALGCGCIPGIRSCSELKRLKKVMNDAYLHYRRVKNNKEEANKAWLAYKNASATFSSHWMKK